jgi:2-C-methyl-D-erythritol 4-phosphate cytidylyltransferase
MPDREVPDPGAPVTLAVWGIVVAAGRGERYGSPKQFAALGDARVVDRAVARSASVCDAVVVVLPPGIDWDGVPVAAAVVGGATRSDSVRAALAAIPDEAEIVIVHDAARPLASKALFDSVVDAVRGGADAAVPAIAVSDTVKRVEDGRVVATLVRDDLVAVQTPQAFRASALRAAHARGGDATDDAALVETAGGAVVLVAGERWNLKITDPDDLRVVRALDETEHEVTP